MPILDYEDVPLKQQDSAAHWRSANRIGYYVSNSVLLTALVGYIAAIAIALNTSYGGGAPGVGCALAFVAFLGLCLAANVLAHHCDHSDGPPHR